MENREEKISQIREIIESSEKPLMIHDDDTDGTTSYFILKNRFSNIKYAFPYMKEKEKFNVVLDEIPEDTDTVIFFDTAEIDRKLLEKIKDKNIVIVDHHPLEEREFLEEFDITYFNPLDFDHTDNRPACYWAWRVAGRRDEDLFYVSLGSVADFFLLEVVEKLWRSDYDTFKVLFSGLSKEEEENLAEVIESTSESKEWWIRHLTYEGGLIDFKNLFDFIYKMETMEEVKEAVSVLESLTPRQIKEQIEKGDRFPFDRYSKQREKLKELVNDALSLPHEKFLIYEYRGRESFTRAISEELMHRRENASVVMVCYKKIGSDFNSCSFRSRDVDVNRIIRDSIEGLNGKGGGHKFAGGTRITKRDYEIFKRNVMSSVENELAYQN